MIASQHPSSTGEYLSTSDQIALWNLIATLLSATIALSAFIFAIYTFKKQLAKLSQQLTLQHFADYTKRYQEIILKFPEDINEPAFKLQGRNDYSATMRQMRAYFDLCFEEWYLNSQGLIDAKIWG